MSNHLETVTPGIEQPPEPGAQIDFDAPYERTDYEAWKITEELLKHRLGDVYARNGRDIYATPPPGSHTHGFQQEYPVQLLNSASDGGVVMNLVLKGYHSPSRSYSRPIWLSTHIGLLLREVKSGSHIMFEHLGFVQEPTNTRLRIDDELFNTKAQPMDYGLANRSIKLLRMARANLYLPEWLIHLQENPEQDQQ